jgi:hypothetical protein
MSKNRDIHPDFLMLLGFKDPQLVKLFKDLRELILGMYPSSNELLYHTHALTSVFTVSEKLADAFCMIPVYSNHLNLGFNKGALLKDPHKLLTGTGNLIRHIDIHRAEDYRNKKVKDLVKNAIQFAIEDMEGEKSPGGKTISKIKT